MALSLTVVSGNPRRQVEIGRSRCLPRWWKPKSSRMRCLLRAAPRHCTTANPGSGCSAVANSGYSSIQVESQHRPVRARSPHQLRCNPRSSSGRDGRGRVAGESRPVSRPQKPESPGVDRILPDGLCDGPRSTSRQRHLDASHRPAALQPTNKMAVPRTSDGQHGRPSRRARGHPPRRFASATRGGSADCRVVAVLQPGLQ